MKTPLRLALVGTICLAGASFLSAAAGSPPVHRRHAPFAADWVDSIDHELLPGTERRGFDIQDVIEPATEHSHPDPAAERTASPSDQPAFGIRVGVGSMEGGTESGSQLGGMAGRRVSEPVVAESNEASLAHTGATLESFSQWLSWAIEQWQAESSTSVRPWAILGGGCLLLIVLARLMRSRHQPDGDRAQSGKQSHSAVKNAPRIDSPVPQTALAATSTEETDLAQWLESQQADDAAGPGDYALRDKSEERRQLESWRKLSQVASKAFILEEEGEAARQHAMWLGLLAILLGAGGLGIVATSCLKGYSLLVGACMAAASLVILGLSGLKVVFHRLRRWILLRPVRH